MKYFMSQGKAEIEPTQRIHKTRKLLLLLLLVHFTITSRSIDRKLA